MINIRGRSESLYKRIENFVFDRRRAQSLENQTFIKIFSALAKNYRDDLRAEHENDYCHIVRYLANISCFFLSFPESITIIQKF